MDAPSKDLELRQALARGDRRQAAALFVSLYADDVFACCRAMLGSRTQAEDLTQDTFVRAIDKLSTFRGDSSPRTWLLSIARNGCLDALRSRRSSPLEERSADDEDGPEIEEVPAGAPIAIDHLVAREDAERGLAVLGEIDRALVVLHFGHGVGFAELAEAFTLREGSLRMRLSRATEKIRAALADGAKPLPNIPWRPRPTRAAPLRIPESLGSAPRSPLRETLSADSRARLDSLVEAC